MLEKAKMMVEKADEMKKLCLHQMVELGMEDFMNGEAFEIYRKTYELMDISLDLVLEQAILFTEMDEKLDKLLQRLEEKEV